MFLLKWLPIYCLAILLHEVTPIEFFKLEDLIPLKPEFDPEKFNVQWISETSYVFIDKNRGVNKFNLETGESEILLDATALANLDGYTLGTFSKDTKNALLFKNRMKVYRHSSFAEYAVYNIKNRTLNKIDKEPLQVVVWAPGDALAYVKKNNVYYVPDVTKPQEAIPLTTSGIPGEVYNGVNDWIYEEEVFSAAEAMWFSKDGKYLAVASYNDTEVESMVFPVYGRPLDFNVQYPQMLRFKYPKVGRKNPEVKLQVMKLDSSKETFQIPAPEDILGNEYILGRVTWITNDIVLVMWLNRRQNKSVLISCELPLNVCNIVQENSEPNGWIELTDPLVDKSGTKMIYLHPMWEGNQRFMHIVKYDFTTFETRDLTPGNSTVSEILAWDQTMGIVYYTLAPSLLPWQRQMWAASESGNHCLSCSEKFCAQASASFSPGGKFAILTCNSLNVPPRILLFKSQDWSLKLINDNAKLKKKLSNYALPLTLFNIIPLQNDLKAHIQLFLPPFMDKNKQYPMIVRVYSGPGTSRVKDKYELDYHTYLTTNRSIIVASIDVRGSDAMDVDSMFAMNNALGTVEITDTILAIQRILDMYPFIDRSKVGVWGWSYGGYATTMMLMKDYDDVIKCGAAVAPVTSWYYYDSIYTERYMGIPQNNSDGYKNSNLMAHVEKLRDKKYLLIHGSGDDNVHYQNSMMLSKAMQRADIPFEQMSYTDENHSLFGVSRHLYHTLDRFWTECFA